MTHGFEWQFGGWLHGVAPLTAWVILGSAAIAGLALVIGLYRRTLRELPFAARNILTVLRGAIVLLLLLCLANPSHVEKPKPPETGKKTLAVVVDRSASMSEPDFRRATRLADAVRIWKQHTAEADAAFGKTMFYWFATRLNPAASFDEALQAAEPGPETHLFASLRQALDDGPDAIVCLTDGLDTTGAANDDLANEALRRNVPLYFVVGMNHLTVSRGGDVGHIREVKVPAKVLRQTRFFASAVFELAAPEASQVPAELWSGDRKLAATQLPVRSGLNTLPWTVAVDAGEAGTLPIEFRLGSGAKQLAAARTVRVVNTTTLNVLYYEGALQWGFRFLRNALESDPSFHLTAILNPALGVQTSVAPQPDTMMDLPDNAADLKRFQVVVLAHVFANQLTTKQQQALTDYVRGGGGVLFISPDTAATRAFSGTLLEQMLPVVFQSPSGATQAPAGFQLDIPAAGDQTFFDNEAVQEQAVPPLTPFAPGPDAAGASLFRPGPDAPKFSTRARVEKVKPGADILAVAPDDSSAALVARQRFGEGFAAALNTDLLWRWKLSLPSTSRAVEVFWQQFILSLAKSPSGTGVQLTTTMESPSVFHTVTLQIEDASDAAPVVETVSPGGAMQRLAVTRAASTNGPAWEARFIPDEPGAWRAQATAPDGMQARDTILVGGAQPNGRTLETMNLPPDVDGLRRLADSTGGALIGDAPVFPSARPAEDGLPQPIPARPLWDTRWLAGLLLGLYAVELVVRRMFRLL